MGLSSAQNYIRERNVLSGRFSVKRRKLLDRKCLLSGVLCVICKCQDITCTGRLVSTRRIVLDFQRLTRCAPLPISVLKAVIANNFSEIECAGRNNDTLKDVRSQVFNVFSGTGEEKDEHSRICKKYYEMFRRLLGRQVSSLCHICLTLQSQKFYYKSERIDQYR